MQFLEVEGKELLAPNHVNTIQLNSSFQTGEAATQQRSRSKFCCSWKVYVLLHQQHDAYPADATSDG
jgi:hypothetical protein